VADEEEDVEDPKSDSVHDEGVGGPLRLREGSLRCGWLIAPLQPTQETQEAAGRDGQGGKR
jgi:hypothetical protein